MVIPLNLNLEQMLLDRKVLTIKQRRGGRYVDREAKCKNLIKYIENCHYIVHLILINAKQEGVSKAFYVNLSKKVLWDVMGKPACEITFSILLRLNVIEINRKYLFGQSDPRNNFCMSYRLSANYRGPVGFNLPSQKLLTGIQKGKLKLKNWKFSHLPEYMYQVEQLLRINFDFAGATSHITKISQNDTDKLAYLTEKISSLSLGKTDHTIDDRGRFYSTITNIETEIRPFIIDNSNRPLIYIDTVSSQTFHLLKLLKLRLHIREYKSQTQYVVANLSSEIQKLESILLSSTGIYSYVAEKHQEAFNAPILRDKVKDLWIQCFLSTSAAFPKLSPWAKSLFPEITKCIDTNRANLWAELHKAEADFIHGRIVRRIALEVKLATLFVIHDGLLVDENSFDEVYNICQEEAIDHFSFTNEIEVTNVWKVERLKLPENNIAPLTNLKITPFQLTRLFTLPNPQ
jgi:hypothetical protein